MGRDEPIERALQVRTSRVTRTSANRGARDRGHRPRSRAPPEDSVHAAGVVIGDAPLVNYLPLKLSKDSRDDSRRIVTQFDMHGVEDLGLLKMDFLGLRTLSVIEDTLSHLRRRDVELDIDHVPLDDGPCTRCSAAPTRPGSSSSREADALAGQARADRFEDLMALVALYRPGPLSAGMHVEYAERKHGTPPGVVPAPGSRGDPVRDVRDHGLPGAGDADRRAHPGYSMAEADTLRQAMGKKIRAKLMVHREKFIEAASTTGTPRGSGRTCSS